MAKTDPTESFNVDAGFRDTPEGQYIGRSATALVGFYGTTPIVQRGNASQAALGTTAATTTSPWGFATSTQADAITTLVNEMRTVLVNLGIMKGSA